MAAQLDQRRILHRAAFFVELFVLPVDLNVRICAVIEEFPGQFERRHVACRRRRTMRRVADSGGAVCAGAPLKAMRRISAQREVLGRALRITHEAASWSVAARSVIVTLVWGSRK